jgi:hypothetical protein
MKVYLAKQGKVSGPHTEEDIARMSASGELDRYAWVWRSVTPGWHPLDPMPSAPPEELPTLPVDGPPARVERIAPPPARKHLKLVGDLIEGVCHDYRNVVAGRVVSVHDQGCELLVSGAHASTPKFGERSKVYLNLLNSKNGQTMDIVANLQGVTQTKEGLLYQLAWESVPELLRASG